jgi:HxlR-like helix-turn-helix
LGGHSAADVCSRLPDIDLDVHETYLAVSMNCREARTLNTTEDLELRPGRIARRDRLEMEGLMALRSEAHRFGELRRVVEGISEKMLIQHLKEMEADGIVKRKDFKEVPPP